MFYRNGFNFTCLSKLNRTYIRQVYRVIHNVGLNDIPKVTIGDIRKLLRQKGFAVQDGWTAISTKCALCSAQSDLEHSKVYINKTTGHFLCPKCNTHGEWSILERFFKKSKLDSVLKDFIEEARSKADNFQQDWQAVLKETTPMNKLSDSEVFELFRLFEFPYHQDAARTLCDVRVDGNRTTLYFPHKNSLDVTVGYQRLQAGREDCHDHRGLSAAGLYTCRAYKAMRSEQAVLVPSIQDLLSLAAHKVPGCLVWLSSGVLPPIVLPVLENFQKLCIWGEWDNMRSVADKLVEERCYFVRPTDGLVTATEAAAAGLSLKALVADAKPAAHRSITTFAALRDDVYADLTNSDRVRGVKWSRFPALVRLLGGHRRGELTILTGPTGCGKTTLCAEMSLDLAQQGVNTLWGSFEIRNSRLARTMLQQFAGVPLEQNLQDFHKYADEFQKLPLYYLAFHGHQPIKVVMEAVEHARYMHDIQHVIIDNVQFMLGLGNEREGQDRYFRQDAVVAAFRTFATARHTHVTLVMHPRKERESEDLSTSSIFGSAKASQEADNVLIIQDKRLTAVRGKKFLQVAKNRYSGDLGIVPLEFDKDALSYQAKKKVKPSKVEDIDREEEGKHQNVESKDFNNQDDSTSTIYSSEYSAHNIVKKHKHSAHGKRRHSDGDNDSFLKDVLNVDK